MGSVTNIAASDSEKFDVGDVVDIEIATRDAGGTLADPDTLSVTVRPGGQDATTFVYLVDSELTRTGTGLYNLAYPPQYPGIHQVRAVTTGGVGAEPGYFNVRPNNVG